MKKNVLFMVAALLLCGAVSAQNWGTPDAHAKSSNTPIVASVKIDGEVVTPTTNYRLGAFVGEELRGLAAPHDNNFWIQVFYNEGTSEDISFKLYDGTDEYTTCNVTKTTQEAGWGTPNEPVVLDFASTQIMTQTTALAAGWNWWSTPIEMNGNNGLQQLENSISQYGTYIKSQSGFVQKRGNNWVGNNLSSIQNEQFYRINVTDASTVVMTGVYANPSEHEITVNNGWTWIGYPVSVPQTINSALSGSGLVPTNGDVIKGQGGTPAQFRNGQWVPATFTFTPGAGYMYNSKASESKSFVFVNNRSEMVQDDEKDLFWTNDIHSYENNLVVFAVVYIGNEEQRNDALELGAFVNGKCTGNARLFYVEEDDRYYAAMTIGGSNGNQISFRLIDEDKNIEYGESCNILIFSENAVIGDLDNPYKVCFNTLGVEEANRQVALYPNPVNRGENFKLNIPQDEEVIEVTIINILGSVVRHDIGALKSTVTGIPVAGVYTVKVVCRSGNSYYGRLIVK